MKYHTIQIRLDEEEYRKLFLIAREDDVSPTGFLYSYILELISFKSERFGGKYKDREFLSQNAMISQKKRS